MYYPGHPKGGHGPKPPLNTPLVGICIFLKLCRKMPETSRKICKDLFCFPILEVARKKILENTCACVLGLELSCPWPRECVSARASSRPRTSSKTPPLKTSHEGCQPEGIMCDAVCRNREGNARRYLSFASKPCITVRVGAGMPA